MRLVFMGTPAYVVPLLDALAKTREIQIVGVFTLPDRRQGRGRQLEMTPVKRYCLEKGLPLLQPASLRSAAALVGLRALKPDVIVVAAYGRLLPKDVLDTPPYGCLNLHPSLLPRFRGPSPVATAILEGEATTGVTLMVLDEGMDTGPIIARQEYRLSGEEIAETLTTTLFQQGTSLLLRNLAPWAAGRLTAMPQNEAKATTTRKLERGDGEASWRLTAVELERRRRAFTPWPGLFTRWQDKVLKLLDVEALAPADSGSQAQAGQVVPLAIPGVPAGIGTAEGVLGLKTLQLEGRRVVPAEEFLRGHPGFLGTQL